MTSNSDLVPRKLSRVASIVGALLMLAYLVALGLQFTAIGADDGEWARRIELLGGLEALAFAAAGALLGTTVQQRATESAESRAQANEEAAKKGMALESAVRAKLEQAPQAAAAFDNPEAFEQGMRKELEELADVADRAPTI
jgi:hypothetical protein